MVSYISRFASIGKGVNYAGVGVDVHVSQFYRKVTVTSLYKLDIQFGKQVVCMLADDTGVDELTFTVLFLCSKAGTEE